MRKSQAITLVLLGTAAAALVAYNLDKPEDTRMFRDSAECSSALDQAQCESGFAVAKQEHEQTAPRFTQKEECEAQFGAGNCERKETAAASGSGMGSFFMPMMLGYMMGSQGAFSPLYRDRAGNVMTGGTRGGQTVGRLDPGQGGSLDRRVQRGGFGSSAAATGASAAT